MGNAMRINQLFVTICLLTTIILPASVSASDNVTSPQDQVLHQNDPDEVFYVVYLADVTEINGQEQSFDVNMAVRLRWKDERLAHSDSVPRTLPLEDVWNPMLLVANQRGRLDSSLPEIVEVEPDGTVRYLQRYIGTVTQPLRLSKFPRDTHTFTIQFVSPGYRSGTLKFVPDRADRSDQMIGGSMSEKLSLPDWHILDFKAETRALVVAADLEVPGFIFTFTAQRYFRYYLWQMIVPQILILMMSWGAFWINPSMASTQIGLATSSMLTLIAHRFLLATQLPKLPYLTRLDVFIMLNTLLVFAALVEVFITSSLAHSDRTELGLKMDRWCRFIFPVTFGCILILSFWK